MEPLIKVEDLKTYFFTSDGTLPAVDDVSFHINPGETLGVVGESGCGKSVTALSIMRLVPVPPGRFVGGRISFRGRELLGLPEEDMRGIRGNDIAMIFQEPMTSLNPVFSVGEQIAEAVRLHQGADPAEAMRQAENMLRLVAVPDPRARLREYPHQLSGGMRQRVMIAMALCCNPQLLIADEPTTALDVTIQAQILDLLKRLRSELGMAIMLITHDLGVVAEMADRVLVMYSGRVVEEAPVRALFADPLHPYTRGLLECIPRIDRPRHGLETIEGIVPNPLLFPSGCRFHPRCKSAWDRCAVEVPPMLVEDGRKVACHRYDRRGRAGEVA